MDTSYDQSWYVLSLAPVPGQVETLAHLVRTRWKEEPVEVRNPDTGHVVLELYLATEVEALLLRSALVGEGCVAGATVSCTDPADWERSFRGRFRARDIGQLLRIRPVWEQDGEGDGGRTIVWIDPGLSFGTGEHFTTTFCLEMMDRLWLNSAPSSLLDVGTGSGILAIAAARLGCPRVVAIEAEAGVLPITRQNLERNEVTGRVELRRQDIREEPPAGVYDVVCANLFAGLLTDFAAALRHAARKTLILSGMREFEIDGVADVYIRLGGREVVRDGDGEWAGLVVEFGPRGVNQESEQEGGTN